MNNFSKYMQLLIKGTDLSVDQAKDALGLIFQGQVNPSQVAAFLTALETKGSSVDEIAGCAKSLREHAVKIDIDGDNVIDTCGTGGAKIKTFNISTAAAIVAAAAKIKVAKHGNRAITSKCGSADVLESLGVKIDANPQTVAKCINRANIGFMFAPMFHPAMKYVQPVRRELGFRTIFNILGPLANPALAKGHLMGVALADLVDKIINVHKILGTKRLMIVHCDGADEITGCGKALIRQLFDGQETTITLDPREYDLEVESIDQLKTSDDKEANATIIRDILSGKEVGPKRNAVVLNAAAAIIVGNKADNFKDAIALADNLIASGKAGETLENLIRISNEA